MGARLAATRRAPLASPCGVEFYQHFYIALSVRLGWFWVFLDGGPFAAKAPDYAYWILLDFLGFSRQNRDLSIGYAGFSSEIFSRRPFPKLMAPLRLIAGVAMWKGGIAHEQSLP
jgi:hypothetical protein